MTRYRIIRRPSQIYQGTEVYDIQRRRLLWWKTISFGWLSLEAAEKGLMGIRLTRARDWYSVVIKEYD
jgi:hypothetical protein